MALGLVLALIALLVWLTGAPGRDPDLVKVGRIQDFRTEQPVHFEEHGFWLVLLASGKFLALSDLDTHPAFREQGCRIRWRPDIVFEGRSGWFRGDCSGSNFDLEGRVASGPSPRSMDSYRALLTEESVWVDMRRLYCGAAPASDYKYPLDCVYTGAGTRP